MTICHLLATLFVEAPFELIPIFPGSEIVCLLRQHLNHVYHREPPGLGGFVKHSADGLAIKVGSQNFHGDAIRWPQLHHQPRMPNPAALLNPDLRGNALFQRLYMADDADHLAAGVQ